VHDESSVGAGSELVPFELPPFEPLLAAGAGCEAGVDDAAGADEGVVGLAHVGLFGLELVATPPSGSAFFSPESEDVSDSLALIGVRLLARRSALDWAD
jgi:hypothetical protein